MKTPLQDRHFHNVLELNLRNKIASILEIKGYKPVWRYQYQF